MISIDFDVWVQADEFIAGRLHLRAAEVGGGVEYLALQVRKVYAVAVGQGDCAYSGGGKIVCHRRAEASCTYNDHTAVAQPALSSTPKPSSSSWRL